VRAPFGVEVAQVVPSTLSLELEKSARRVVPVVPQGEGTRAPGYGVGRTTSDPATVEIVGPDSRVRQISEATTEPVSVKDAKTRIRDGVTIGVLHSAVHLAQPQNANVTVEIWPAPLEKKLADVPVRWRNLSAGPGAPLSAQHVTRGGAGLTR